MTISQAYQRDRTICKWELAYRCRFWPQNKSDCGKSSGERWLKYTHCISDFAYWVYFEAFPEYTGKISSKFQSSTAVSSWDTVINTRTSSPSAPCQMIFLKKQALPPYRLTSYLLYFFKLCFDLTEAILMKTKVIFQHGYSRAVKMLWLSFLFKMKCWKVSTFPYLYL